MTQQQIALGTAQFGLDYGITNARGRVPADEAARMLATAWDGGVRTLDTAPAYGGSEAALGPLLARAGGDRAPLRRPRAGGDPVPSPDPWRIVTKTLPLRTPRITPEAIAAVDAAFRRSLADLRMPAVDTLLVHHADDLLAPGGETLYGWLRRQQAEGRCARIGASVYDGAQVRALLQRHPLDVVQLPASIADQRLLADGSVQRLRDAGVEIHVRSLYLQGLLLADPAFVAARFPAQAAWAQRLRAECASRGVAPLQACLSFFRSQPAFHVAVLGAAGDDEVRALLAAWHASPPMDWSAWAVDNPSFTDPRQWKTT